MGYALDDKQRAQLQSWAGRRSSAQALALRCRIVLLAAVDGADVGLTQSAVHRIWRAFGLGSNRQKTRKLSKNPQFIEKVGDVAGL